jgi:two-component system sensor histidine kinase TctE
MKTRDPSLFTRLAVTIALVLAVGAAGLTSLAWYSARAAADEAYDRLLVGAVLQIAEALTVQNGELTVDLPISAFEMLALSDRDRIFYRLVGPKGELLTGYPDLAVPAFSGERRDRPVVSDGMFRDVAVRIASVGRSFAGADIQGWAQVVVAQTREARFSLARDLTLNATALVLIMSAIAFGGVIFAVRYSLKPLTRIEGALTQRDPQDLTPLSLETPREIRALVGSINHFMSRLGERMELMQRFIADAAHQIRTPLTALSGQVDLLVHETDAGRRRHQLERVQVRTKQLGRLANQLLSHAMVLHRRESVPFERIDLVRIARIALRNTVPISLNPDIVISFEAPGTALPILGDRVSVREAISNILDNAVQHGAISRLEITLRRCGASAVLEILDDGPGIPRSQWVLVTQRFAKDPSGHRSGGLGLAITSEVAATHQGQLSFLERDEKGFAVILSFPLENPDEAP